MVIYRFTHLGRPQVKQRPRSGKNGGRLYTPKATLEAQALLALDYHGPLFDGPIEIGMGFHDDHTNVFVRNCEETSALRGDIDNYVKLVLDGLEGLAFKNDRQVMKISASKGA